MPKLLRLDLRRLERDLSAAANARGPKLAPGGRPATGLMELVRQNLDALVALQASGSTWGEIAAGLTAQGHTKADGRPLTGTALTGLISSVRRQEKRREAKVALRKVRADLPARRASAGLRTNPKDTAAPRLRLSAELETTPAPVADDEDAPLTETQIREFAINKLSHLFKKD